METATRYVHDGTDPVRSSTYANGVALLREAKQERPFTFRENILARVEAYERGDKSLFDTWLDSCTGVANKRNSTLFQLVSSSPELIHIPAGFSDLFLPVDYDTIKGIELDSSEGKYNQGLTKDEILDHPAWLLAVEGDAHLLKKHRDIVFAELKNPKTTMGFYVRQNTEEDELRALLVDILSDNSYADGGNYLNVSGSFLRGSPVVGARSARAKKSGLASTVTEESALELEVRQILSPLDRFVAPINEAQYFMQKEKAEKELLAWYKKR